MNRIRLTLALALTFIGAVLFHVYFFPPILRVQISDGLLGCILAIIFCGFFETLIAGLRDFKFNARLICAFAAFAGITMLAITWSKPSDNAAIFLDKHPFAPHFAMAVIEIAILLLAGLLAYLLALFAKFVCGRIQKRRHA